jgi:MFS family permease
MNLLRGADFRNLWAGQTVSLLGDQVTLIALPLTAVLVLDASAADMGYLMAAALIPHLLFSLPAGAWLERAKRRRALMIASDLARAVLLGSLSLAYTLDALTFAQLYGVAFLTGTLAVVFDISYMTVYVAVTRREDYVQANSLLNGSRAFSYIAGPSLGGILVQLLTAPATLLVDAASFLASAVFLARIRAPEPPLEAPEGSMWTQVKEGMEFIARHSVLRPGLVSVATLNFFNFAFSAIFILYATRELGISAGTLGVVLGAGAAGACSARWWRGGSAGESASDRPSSSGWCSFPRRSCSSRSLTAPGGSSSPCSSRPSSSPGSAS